MSKESDRLLTIDEIKANPAYDKYLKTMSYGGAQRACQRDLTASLKDAEWAVKCRKEMLDSWHRGKEQGKLEKDAEFEARCKECEYDPQAAEFGWFLEHGWLPPEEAKIKDAECQARVERIFAEIEKFLDPFDKSRITPPNLLRFETTRGRWQALKSRELKEGNENQD